MSNKFQPGEETFDDVSGHRLNRNVVDDEAETEGHRFAAAGLPQDEETEGHRLGWNQALPADDDEGTEGHKASRV
jgi:hypothetical protein